MKAIDGGVETVTTSKDAKVTETIRRHVRQMKQRVASGQPMRRFDPLFVELFKHYDKIEMRIQDVPGGVKVIETSKDPRVVLLIRQHAKVVSEFVARGFDRAHQASPLPKGYGAPEPAASKKGETSKPANE